GLVRELGAHRLSELLRLNEVGGARLAPDEVRVGRVGKATGDRRVGAVLDPVEALGRALARLDERAVALVDVARQELRAVGVGARDEERRHVRYVGREARRDECADESARGDEHLAAHVSAFFFARELIFEMDAGGARLDHRLHELEGVQRTAEPCFRVGDDRREPVAFALSLAVLDLIRALERRVDLLDDGGDAVSRVERLVRVHLAREVRVRRDLPAREVDGLEAGADLLDGLVAGHGAERVDVRLAVEELPEALGPQPCEGVFDVYRAAQPFHVCFGVGTNDAVEARCMQAFAGSGLSRSRHGTLFSYFDSVTSRSYAGRVKKSSNFGAVDSRTKSSRASGKRPPVNRASPTSRRIRCISSSTTRAKRSFSNGIPSTVALWRSHCQTCAREISAVAASSIR